MSLIFLDGINELATVSCLRYCSQRRNCFHRLQIQSEPLAAVSPEAILLTKLKNPGIHFQLFTFNIKLIPFNSIPHQQSTSGNFSTIPVNQWQ
jgi:hypothetical protein